MFQEPRITPEFAKKVAACPKCHPGIRGWCYEHGAEFARNRTGGPPLVPRLPAYTEQEIREAMSHHRAADWLIEKLKMAREARADSEIDVVRLYEHGG